MNKVILIGNLGADPELRTTGSGKHVCNLRLATNERVKRGEEWVEETTWHSVTVWDKQAEICARNLAKGKKISVDGRIQYRENEGKWYTDIVAHRIEFLSPLERSEPYVKDADEPF